ncbi:MAG: signal peptidase I, partial [Clostridiales bacterium]|nr:signal peptidase I [Clostridiales bacterium]
MKENSKSNKKEKVNSAFSVIWNFITTFIIAVIVISALAFIFVKVAGIDVLTIESESMTPKYPYKSVIFVKEVNPVNIEEGDVITFVSDSEGTLVSHRVVEIDKSTRHFTTKGDANSSNDPKAVSWDNVVGKVVFGVPKLGFLFDNISENKNVWIIVLGVILFISVVVDIIEKHKRKVRAKNLELEENPDSPLPPDNIDN